MNREIKFRAWLIKSKRFHDWGKIQSLGQYMANYFNGVTYSEDQVILQQFTGLKDKNGKEIYEGDIIKYDPFNIKEYKNSIVKVYDLRAFHWWHELEQMLEMKNKCNIRVIGNIFETPELLK